MSVKIGRGEDIVNYSVVQLLNFISEIEVIAMEMDKDLSEESFDDFFRSYIRSDLFSITTKAQFHSPGDIWNKIRIPNMKVSRNIYYALAAYAMLFGNENLGMDGVIDLETRQRLWNVVISRLESNNMEKAAQSLELTRPSFDTSPLEVLDGIEAPKL